MKITFQVFSIYLLIHVAVAPPPRRIEPEKNHEDTSQEKSDVEDFGLEYNRYLKEVIDLLESDTEFKKKLEDAHEVDIRNGQIAKELEFVDHKVRTKLDEVKRQEIERLRHLAQKQNELANGINTDHVKVSSEHLDHENPHTFEMEDLKKLIAKVSADLNEADEKRRREFKEYEMQKEFEKQQKLKHLEEGEREAFEKQLKENETKHKQHEPLHQPGSKQQLEEVWEKQDHMENQEFDPRVFFQLHDLDGNGFWDHNEVKALFLKELDKMYQAGAPEDDMKERAEEMERMREHVFNEADKNKDGLISFEEFLEKTKQPEFEKDPGWESLDQKPVYTHEEYLEFERRRQEEVQKMIQQGLIPPQPTFNGDPAYHSQGHYVQYHPQQAQGYPGGQPQGKDHRYAPSYPNQPPHQVHPHHQVTNQQPHVGLNQDYQYQQHNVHQGKPDSHQPSNEYHNNQAQPNSNSHAQAHQSQQNQPQQEFQQHQQNQPQQGFMHHQQNQPQQGFVQQHQKNQPQQGFQQPYHNQPQQHQNRQEYQPPQQTQQNQASASSMNDPAQAYHSQSSRDHAGSNYQNKPQGYQSDYDPNMIHPNQPQLNLKYSKNEGGSRHSNVIDSQQKAAEEHNAKQSQFSN